jgi:release factor glutamine methyltransferase
MPLSTTQSLLDNTPLDKVDALFLLGDLLEQRLSWPRSALISKDQEALPLGLIDEWKALEQKRLLGIPVAYLVGKKAFHAIELKVSPAVLIPRPETELLVDLATEEVQNQIQCNPYKQLIRILDLGTGSGAIALAIGFQLKTQNHSNPIIEILGIDISSAAIELAKENASRLGLTDHVKFSQSHWYDNIPSELKNSVDLIVSNPPYIHPDDPHLSQGDLRFEPRDALTDHVDGFGCIRTILSGCNPYLSQGGWVAIEHGFEQADLVRTIMRSNELTDVRSVPDLAGHLRVSMGRKSSQSKV